MARRPEARQSPPRCRLFLNPRPGDFSYRPPRVANPAPEPIRPNNRYFSKPGFASDVRRRRPDVNALAAFLHKHLDILNSSPDISANDSRENAFFAEISPEPNVPIA